MNAANKTKAIDTINALALDIEEGHVVPGVERMFNKSDGTPCCTLGHLYTRLGIPQPDEGAFTSPLREFLGDEKSTVGFLVADIMHETDRDPLLEAVARPIRIAKALRAVAQDISNL